MVEEYSEDYKIPHYMKYSSELVGFEVIKPSLVNNKFVAYLIKGEDDLGPFEGNRRYNEFYALR